MKAIVEMQVQSQFLGGESAGGQAGAKLIEHVRQQKRERLQQN